MTRSLAREIRASQSIVVTIEPGFEGIVAIHPRLGPIFRPFVLTA